MNRTDRILSIIENLLKLLNEESEWTYTISWPTTTFHYCSTDTEEEWDWDEITEDIKDNSPRSLKQEVEHLNNLIDLICDTFWLEKYVTENWALWIAWDKWLLEEIAKARKKLGK